MRNKEITQKSLNVVERLLARVAEMSDSEYIQILGSMARFYQYSFRNQIILHAQDASQVAGYRQWKDKYNRVVKKGEKAIWILAPVIKKIEKENEETKKTEEKSVVIGFNSVPVFDISQTDGEEIKKNFTTKAEVDIRTLEKVAGNLGYSVIYKPLKVAIGGFISHKEVTLNSNLSELENIGALIHELSHGELGHTKSSTIITRSLAEQQAETTTAIICELLKIERKSDFYLKSWKLDKSIKKSFSKINRAVGRIVNGFSVV